MGNRGIWDIALSLALSLCAASAWAQSAIHQTLHDAATATGDGTILHVPSYSSVNVQITSASGTYTLVFRVSQNGTTWTDLACRNQRTGAEATSASATTDSWACPTSGARFFKAQLTACTGCTVTVMATASVAVSRAPAGTGGGGGGGSTVSINSVSESSPNFLDSLDIAWANASGAIRAWFAPTINVKAPPYNAVCDGVTDDRAAIQAAIDAAPSYATIVIDGSSGLCAIGASSDPAVRSLRVNAKTGLTFEGRRGGGFVVLPSVETHGWTHSLTGVRMAILVQDSTKITFRGLEFRGNRDGQSLVNATVLGLMVCTGCVVERSMFVRGGSSTTGSVSGQLLVRGGQRNKALRNEFYNSNPGTSDNARCVWFGDNTAAARIETDSEIANNYIYNCAASAIGWNGTGALIEGNHIHYPTTSGWNGSGMSLASYASGSVTIRRVRVVNNYIQGAPYHGIQLYTPAAVDTAEDESFVISGNVITGGAGSGIYLLNAQHVQVSNNVLQDNERGVYVLGHSHDINISDNTIWDSRTGDSRTMLYGIVVVPGSGGSFNISNVLIANNRVTRARYIGIQAAAGPTSSESISNVQILDNHVRDSAHASGDSSTTYADGINVSGPGLATNVVVRGNIALGSTRNDLRIGNVADGSSVIVDPDSNIYAIGSNLGYATANTLTVNSATPSVQYLNLWREANTSSTTITNLTNGRDGQTIRIYFTSTNTTIQHGSNIALGSGANFTGQVGDILELQLVGSTWREVSRSRWATGGGGGSSAFNDITSGTNTSATMTVGTGGTITYSGSGTVNASQFRGNSTVALAHGGTNQPTWTASRCVRVNTGGTALESASADCVSAAGSSGAVQMAGSGGALADSGCSVSGGVMTCTGFNSSGSGTGYVTLTEGSAPGAPSGSGEHRLYFDSSDSLLKSHENGGSVVTYYSSANKTRIQEWGGDLVGLVGGTAGHIWDDDPLSTACTPTAVTGTNQSFGVCTFPDSDGAYGRQLEFDIPPGGITNLSAIIWWRTSGTGDARFRIQTLCYASNAVGDTAYSNSTHVTAAAGTSGRLVRVAASSIPIDGCDGSERMAVRFSRDRTEGSDTLNAALDVRRVLFYAEVKQ